jgi:DNA invertase Pin-like site-specific DNA recombinase
VSEILGAAENQLLQLREFAAKQGWTVVREYCDYETGSKADRVQFQQMFAKQEQIKRSQRTKAGLARVRSEGRRLP